MLLLKKRNKIKIFQWKITFLPVVLFTVYGKCPLNWLIFRNAFSSIASSMDSAVKGLTDFSGLTFLSFSDNLFNLF